MHYLKREDRPTRLSFSGNQEATQFVSESLYVTIESKVEIDVSLKITYFKFIQKKKKVERKKMRSAEVQTHRALRICNLRVTA